MNRTSLLVVLLLGLSSSPVAFDRLPPEWSEAMEVYHGVGTPMEYGRSSVTFGYGVAADYSNEGGNLRLC